MRVCRRNIHIGAVTRCYTSRHCRTESKPRLGSAQTATFRGKLAACRHQQFNDYLIARASVYPCCHRQRQCRQRKECMRYGPAHANVYASAAAVLENLQIVRTCRAAEQYLQSRCCQQKPVLMTHPAEAASWNTEVGRSVNLSGAARSFDLVEMAFSGRGVKQISRALPLYPNMSLWGGDR